MTGLVIKDLYVIKKRIKPLNYLLILLGIIALNFYFKQDSIIYVSTFLPLIWSGIPKSLMLNDTECRWDKYAIGLPTTRKYIILSRYIVSFLTILLASTVGLVVSLISVYIFGGYSFAVCFQYFIIGMYITSIYILIMIPAGYAFGSNGGSLVMMGSVFIILCFVFLLKKINISIDQITYWISYAKNNLLIVCAVLLFALFIISIKISIYFYTKIHS